MIQEKRARRILRLQELLDAWRKRSDELSHSVSAYDATAAKIIAKCADELQEVLDS